MELFVDLFGYLSVVFHGLTLAGQAIALGSALFLVLLARPRAWLLGEAGGRMAAATARLAGWAALAMAAAAAMSLALPAAVLVGTLDLGLAEALGAQFALAGMVRIGLALALAVAMFALGARAPAWLVLPLVGGVLAAATFSTHAAARLEFSLVLLVASGVHQFGAALWIGGMPSFLLALRRAGAPGAAVVVGERFTVLSIVGVVCLLGSAGVLAWAYVGDGAGFYGTAYGVMVSAKIAMTAGLLLLGLGNFRLIRRLRRDRGLRTTRLRGFAEVELGVGIAIFFAAASLTSVPPAVDLREDRVSWQEIVDRNWPRWPRLESPEHGALTQPALQAQLDAEARAAGEKPQLAFVPGSGILPPRNAADIAWSEYNHHWAGILVIAIALLALLHRAGLGIAGHWPLLFLVLAGFLFWRSDPEAWPLGAVSFWDSLRDVEVLQHRIVVLVLVVFALYEWRVRITGQRGGWQPLVFPVLTAFAGVALLTHSHSIANVKEQLLIEISHTPLALAGIAGAWARWLELRLDPPGSRIAGWVWPLCFLAVGVVLLVYREA
jgi:putative copper resistance protein D